MSQARQSRRLGVHLRDVVLYTYADGGFVKHFEARRYGRPTLHVRGYAGGPGIGARRCCWMMHSSHNVIKRRGIKP